MATDDARVEVHGGRELASGSKRLAGDIAKAAPQAFRDQVADRAAASLRVQVPRQSGALVGDVSADVAGEAAVVGYDGGVPYAAYIEFGGFHGRPYVSRGRYLYPTALDVVPQLEAVGGDSADDEIRGFRWSSPT